MSDPRPPRFRALFFVFVIAFALRFIFCFWAVPRFNLANGPQTEEFFTFTDGYVDLAQNLVNHHKFAFSPEAPSTTFRAPVFPFVLAIGYAFLKNIATSVLIVNCLSSAITAIFSVLIAAQLIPRMSRLARYSAVLLPFSIWYCASSYSDTLLTLTVLAFVYFLVRTFSAPGMRNAAWTGITFAATVLTKAVMLPFPPVLIAYGCFRALTQRRKQFITSGADGWTMAGVKCFLVATLIGVPLIGMWSARNYKVSGHFIPVSQGMGFNLLAGTYMLEDWTDSCKSFQYGVRHALADLANETGLDVETNRKHLRPEGHFNLSVELDNKCGELAKRQWKQEPMKLVRKVFGNVLRFWYFTVSPERCAIAAAMSFPLVALGVIGLIQYRKTNMPTFEILMLFMVFFVGTYSIIIVSGPRFSLPILMILAPFAGQIVSNALCREAEG